MLKDKLFIVDNHFSHAKSSSWYNEPEKFYWVRKSDEEHLFLTDSSLEHVDYFNNKKKYAWLLESPEITPLSYNFIKENYQKFDFIFTFDENLLKLSPKFILIPIGGCWINDKDRKIHEKNKNISFILSNKKTTYGHLLRHEIFSKNLINSCDIFGFNNPIENKIIALKDYRFSIVVENTNKNYYFTEKIIDCFITGTIPIYWGCPKIGDFFDINGIVQFENLTELKNILSNLTEDFYISRNESIKKNFIESKKYLVAENLIYESLKNKKII